MHAKACNERNTFLEIKGFHYAPIILGLAEISIIIWLFWFKITTWFIHATQWWLCSRRDNLIRQIYNWWHDINVLLPFQNVMLKFFVPTDVLRFYSPGSIRSGIEQTTYLLFNLRVFCGLFYDGNNLSVKSCEWTSLSCIWVLPILTKNTEFFYHRNW